MKLNPEELDVTPFVTTCEHDSVQGLAYELDASVIDHNGNGPCTCWC